MNIEREIIKIISDHLGISPLEINKNSSLTKDLNASQLEISDLILALEEHFHVHIPEEELGSLDKVEDIINYLSDHIDEPSTL